MIDRFVRRLFLITLVIAPFFSIHAEEPSKPARLNVVDYFLMLPPDRLEAPPKAWLRDMQGGRNVIDKANGYLRCAGDGAQPNFEVALFRFRDDRPLLALCQGALEGADSVELEFYVLGPKGRLQLTARSIFPVADGADRQFILPRNGRTIIVRDKSGKHERRFGWDGAQFVAEN